MKLVCRFSITRQDQLHPNLASRHSTVRHRTWKSGLTVYPQTNLRSSFISRIQYLGFKRLARIEICFCIWLSSSSLSMDNGSLLELLSYVNKRDARVGIIEHSQDLPYAMETLRLTPWDTQSPTFGFPIPGTQLLQPLRLLIAYCCFFHWYHY